MGRWRVRVAFGVLGLAGWTAAAFARDRVLSSEALASAIDVYVDGVIAERAAELACSPPGDRDNWADGGRQLVATLWANGLPDKVARDVEKRLTAPPATDGPKTDCNNPEVAAETNRIAATGWPALHKQMAEAIGLVAVTTAPTDQQFAQVKALFADEAPAEARMLACIAVTQGVVFPIALSDWTATVVDAGKTMVLAGLPRDEVVRLIDSVDPIKIWKKATEAEAGALRKSCAADRVWSDRFYQLGGTALQFEVEKILKPAP